MEAYLLALELHPIKEGKTYEGLPLHCTLVHWFWLNSTKSVKESMSQALENQEAPLLYIEGEEQFTGMTNSGPVPVRVNKVKRTPEITNLHEKIVKILDTAGATYSMPQYIHSGYVPHVTHQNEGRLKQGDIVQVASLYLARADDPAYGNDRTVVSRFTFQRKGES